MEETMKYEEALAQLGVIASKMERGEYDIDQLADQLKQAQQLMRVCRDKLAKADSQIRTILGSE